MEFFLYDLCVIDELASSSFELFYELVAIIKRYNGLSDNTNFLPAVLASGHGFFAECQKCAAV